MPGEELGTAEPMTTHSEVSNRRSMPSKASGLLYGLGFGGFIDGIVLHQILQWHHMVSDVRLPTTTVAGLEVNTLADGFFHAATWFFVLAGSITAIKAWREGRLAPSWSFHFGLILTGWASSTWSRASWTTTSWACIMFGTTWGHRCRGTSPSWRLGRVRSSAGGCCTSVARLPCSSARHQKTVYPSQQPPSAHQREASRVHQLGRGEPSATLRALEASPRSSQAAPARCRTNPITR